MSKTPLADLALALWAFAPREEKERIARAVASYVESVARAKALEVERKANAIDIVVDDASS